MDLDRPTIAAIRGVAVGGGLGLALACDLRFCAADAHLAITPAKLGLVYGHAETRRLVELVGPSRVKDLLFTGRRIETDEALAIGLIDRRIETALEETVLGYARGLAELSQASIRGGKRAVDAVAAGMSQETPGFRALAEAVALGPDFAEGRAAFAAKRAAVFEFRGPRASARLCRRQRRIADGAGARSVIRLRDPSPRCQDRGMPNDVKPLREAPAYVDPISG